VPRPPWWAFLAPGAAPLLLVGGWTLAAARQPAGYDPIRDTISALAARGATDRWIMTGALIGVGCCYALTGWGLRAAGGGRLLLALGGLGTVSVAAFPQPIRGNSVAHTVAASVAFAALALWPVVAACRRSGVALLRPLPGLLATLALIGLILWFVGEIHGGHRGLAERAVAGAEALWPLAVVTSAQCGSEQRE
jgi:hypothetical membrane protein